ncbi:cadherin-related family member 5-like isoform X2 [Paramormyrops kingsleyae]|uniref:cadherin-related family member 5-like isoform X2 n=1 Tax=Paramormyrops kingsleyae TaxID=1676925 RepID=UPI000CD6602D|nr:cadherin-related family member 5-like isoform X2 [Paramormyrops kingsleyae]
MELKYSCVSFGTVSSVLLVFLLLNNGEAQEICSAPQELIPIAENNEINLKIMTITIQEGVTLTLSTNPENAFEINGPNLVVVKSLDFETLDNAGLLEVEINCNKPGSHTVSLNVYVHVLNVNDNAPKFEKNSYSFNVNELTPVHTNVARVDATDIDEDQLFYQLKPVDPKDSYFYLPSEITPNIAVNNVLDYDSIKQHTLILHVQDSPLSTVTSHTATTTITFNILDIDNRPPWFLPCIELTQSFTKICLNSGYRGIVNLTEQAPDALILEPGPVYAVDGDKARNDEVAYRIVAGNEDGIFQINPNSGNITMLKPADVPGPVILTVLASQVLNSEQFYTTTVTFTVVKRSQHPPEFVEKLYEGRISSESGQDSIIFEINFNRPLKVQALDADFANGINPDLKYEVPGNSDFAVTAEGFVLLKGEVMPGIVDLQIRAVDLSNAEAGTTALIVHVLPGTTTAHPTTDMSTTNMTAVTTALMGSTSNSPSTNTLTPTEETTLTTTEGVSLPFGRYRMEDMAALGASLAAVVMLCLVIIGLLIYRIKKGKADWQKLTEASIFRSSFTQGSSGPKDGMQYTNDGFQNDGDTGSVASKVQDDTDLKLDTISAAKSRETSVDKPIPVTSSALDTFLHDSSSLTGSEKTDSEKGVKPILTKERKNEEGYKSVWFKEDIDPNGKKEVVIIPDNEEQDVDDEEDSFDVFSSSPIATPNVFFKDTQKGVKTADDNRVLNVEGADGRNSVNT